MRAPAFGRLRRGTRDTGTAGLPRRRVVIVGGGFAGLFAARVFHGLPVDVTVIDRAAHHLFQPLLYQVGTGVLSEGQIAVPLRGVLKRHATSTAFWPR